MFEILFIEDNPHKRHRITDYLTSRLHEIRIEEAHSFTSGCQKIETYVYSLIIADISLPTYDKHGTESGGRFRPFAGREIGRKITRMKSKAKILFITQYESFSDKGNSYSFNDLYELLKNECGENFIGMIFYDSSKYSWKDNIISIIQKNLK